MKQKNIEELLKYAELENTEWGEGMQTICTLAAYSYLFSDKFAKQLDKEIETALAYAKKHAKIVESQETITRRFTELEWDDR